MKPRQPILGAEFAGTIEAVGSDVSRFQVGDDVFGTSGTRFGAYAEYLAMPEAGLVAAKPAPWCFEQAARMCGPVTAWNFVVEKAKVERGQRVLVNGASGTVGIAAVQIARNLGAHVTGVCSSPHVELVRSLGADRVIDYTREDFTQADDRYDVVFDAVGRRTFGQCRRVLASTGVYLSTRVTLGLLGRVVWTSRIGAQRAMYSATGLRSVPQRLEWLDALLSLVEVGQLEVVVDRSYGLEQIAEAHAYVEQGHKTGNVVVTP